MATCPKCGTTYGPTVSICTQDGTVLSAEAVQDGQVGKVLDGKYRLDSFLSHGGMGSVYRATHIMLDKVVAVKLIRPGLVTSPDVVQRFQREARAASNLNHPNIVAVYDLGQAEDGTLYIAMELLNGPSLKDVIRSTGPMPAARIVSVLKQVASALALAHQHNIIHRDLKPHNIMLVTDREGHEIAKLLDFGIAKTFDDAFTQLTMTGYALGTPQYMAPEQAAGKDVDGRTDLYSLGVILYEMLIGEVPFTDPSTPAILVKQMTEVPEPPSKRKPAVAVSPALEAIALRCLEKDPAKRFDTADALADSLNRIDTGADPLSAAAAQTLWIQSGARSGPTQGTAPSPVAQGHATTAPSPSPVPTSSTAAAAPAAATVAAAALEPAPPASATTRSTVPHVVSAPVAPAVEHAPKAQAGGGRGLWLGLAAVAVLLVAFAAASRLGYLPWGQVPNQSDIGAPTPPPSAAPAQASPAAAGPQAPANRGPDADVAASSGRSTSPAAAPPPAVPATAGPQAPASRGPDPGVASSSGRSKSPAPVEPVTSGRADRNRPIAPSSAASARTSAGPARTQDRATPNATNPPPAQAAARSAASIPENPSVFFRCSGPPEVCGAVRSSMDQALERNNMPAVRTADRAAITVTATVSVLQERVNQDFGTALATRTYSVDLSGESREGDIVALPSARTFSFDAQFGRDRLQENARVIADDVVEKIRAFWKKRTS